MIACVAGIVLLAVPLAASQLSAAGAGEQVVRRASPFLTSASLHLMRGDLTRLEAAAAAVEHVALPRLVVLAHQTPSALLRTTAPGVGAALGRLPPAQRQAERVVGNLERRRGQFRSLASLPGLGLTLKQGVWVGLAVGAALLLAGLVGVLRPRTWLAAALAVGGLGLIVGVLAVGYPGKAADADALVRSLRPFSVQKVRARQAGLASARAVLEGVESHVVPRVAAVARVTPGALIAELGADDSRLSRASLDQTAAALDRFASLVQFSARNQPLEAKADHLPAAALSWLLIVPGVALALAGAVALASERRTIRRAGP